MRKVLLYFVLLSSFSFAFAQTTGNMQQQNSSEEDSHSDKMFHSIGTSVYVDIFNGPITERYSTVTDPFGNTTSQYTYERISGFNYISLIYHFRYNLREMNDEVSFGVSGLPSLGIFVGGSNPDGQIPTAYSGSINFPIMAGINVGAAATKKSQAGVGVYLGTGYEFNAAPLVYAKTVKNKDIDTRWFNPCVSVGLRYESNSYLGGLQEINFKMGFGLAGLCIYKTFHFPYFVLHVFKLLIYCQR